MPDSDRSRYKVLLVEANESHAKIISAKIYKQQVSQGFRENLIIINTVATLSEACYILQADPHYDAIYLDPGRHLRNTQEILRQLKRLSNSPITIISPEDKATVIEALEDAYEGNISIVDKRDIQDLEHSFSRLVTRARRKQNMDGPGLLAAIARLESSVENLWRELSEEKADRSSSEGDTKALRDEVRQQLAEIRNALQAAQNNTLLAVDGIPTQMAEITSTITLLKSNLEKLDSQVSDLKDLSAAILFLAKSIRFVKKNWAFIGGGVLVPLGILLKQIFIDR